MHRVSRFPESLKISRPSLGLFILFIGLLVPLLITACGGDDPTTTPQPTATNTPQPPDATATPEPPDATPTQPVPDPTNTPVPVTSAATATPMPTSTPVPVSLTIMLDELNGSGQSGSVILTNRGAQTEVVVSVTPGISALAHIHDGSCETLGGIVHDLSDTSGASSSMTVNATLDSLIAGSFAVNLHDDEDPSIYTSCGNVAEAGQSLTITLAEMTASGQSGWATLTNRGAQTEVVVSVTPGISALAHIHDGSCETLGGMSMTLAILPGLARR